MLTEADIVPGRHYLCRLVDGHELIVCEGDAAGLVYGGVLYTWEDWQNEGRAILRELDLEALAAEVESESALVDEISAGVERALGGEE